ncbi:MAG: hypothetical protein R2861_10255 [Desulfobacterales bacterium]
MSKGDVAGVSANGSGIAVEAQDTLLGENIQVNADEWWCWLPAWYRSPWTVR